ncbi:MAG: carbohydrate kinase family protein [Bacteroidota bacterium]
MKLTVIGHFCVDVFHLPDGSEETKLGGIYHSIAALANLASDRDTIFPLFGVGEKDFQTLRETLSQFKNVDISGMFQFPGESNRVHYYSDSPNECSLNVSQPIPFSQIKKFLNVDAVYINMISGNDITVNTIDEIRLEVRGKKIPIHLDMHCLTLAVQEDGTRVRKPLADWRRWCFMTDSVQMNEEEAIELSLEHYSDELLAKQMMPLMVKALVITRGEKGATIYQDQHKQLLTTEIPNEKNPDPVSTLGSGDIFGVSFLYAYLKKKNYTDASMFAQTSAAYSTKFSLSEKHQQLKAMRELL